MPGNPFAEELERGNPFAEELSKRGEVPSANYAFRDRASRTILNNLMAMPSASGEVIANTIAASRAGATQAAGAVPRLISRAMGNETPSPTFGERYASAVESEGVLPRVLRNIPRLTTEGIDAAAESIPALLPGGESPGRAYERNLFENAQLAQEMRAAHPVASTAGDIIGDLATLFLGRRGMGLDRLAQRVETKLSGASAKAATTLAGDLNKVLTSPSMRSLARGAGRSAEAGFEAAALDILKDENADPLETAALAAGGQLVGSGFLSASQGLLSGGPLRAGVKMTVLAAGTFGLLQVLKSATPGGEDRILESIETGYDKVAFALAAGAASAALGATRYGRGNTALSDQTRTFLDGISTAHRGTTLSILSDWTEGDPEERATIENVVVAVSRDPTYRGRNEAERQIVQKIKSGSGLARYRTGGKF